MPSPRTAFSTERIHWSGWSRRRPGTPSTNWAWVVERVARRTRSPAGRPGAGAYPGAWQEPVPNDAAASSTNRSCAEIAGCGHDHVGGTVVGLPEAVDRRRGQRPDALLRACDLPPQRRVAEHGEIEQHVDVLGGIVEVRADLLDDHVALAVDLVLIEPRPDDQLAEDVHRDRGVAGRDAHVVDRRLAVGRRVERAAEAFDGLGDRARRRVVARSLERDVLHEMGTPRLVGRFVAGAREHVRLDRDGP